MAHDLAFMLAIMLIGAAGSALLKVLGAHTHSHGLQSFLALT